MQFSAVIFGLLGVGYLVWDAYLTIENGIRLGTWLMAGFALALLVLAQALFRRKQSALWPALLSAIAIICASGFIAGTFVYADPTLNYPAEVWPVFATAVVVTIAFAIVVVHLVRGRNDAP